MSEIRWNPVLGEWVTTATHRQDRTFLPPGEFCPLCPTRPGGFATEIPEETYDIVVFENRFPSFRRAPDPPAIHGTRLTPARPSEGVCEVVVYTPDHDATLAGQRLEKFDRLVRVWTDRFQELDHLSSVQYVFIFENKGEAIGVTLHHPHGQIYAYPFVPPVIERELFQGLQYRAETRRCLFCDVLEQERRAERRVIYENATFTAFVPFFARWPYEVHIYARRHIQALTDLTRDEQRGLAEALKSVVGAYDRLWDRSMPYMMVLHQRPSDARSYGHYHFHIEFYPPHRTPAKLKYLAGSETGAGAFINDALPEEKAAELRAVVPRVTWTDGA